MYLEAFILKKHHAKHGRDCRCDITKMWFTLAEPAFQFHSSQCCTIRGVLFSNGFYLNNCFPVTLFSCDFSAFHINLQLIWKIEFFSAVKLMKTAQRVTIRITYAKWATLVYKHIYQMAKNLFVSRLHHCIPLHHIYVISNLCIWLVCWCCFGFLNFEFY